MRTYVGVLEKQEDTAFGVYFPDIPGCVAAGDTQDEAIENAALALRLFFEGESGVLPEARDFTAITADAEVAGDLADGAVLLGVPYLENEGRTVRINLSLDAGLLHDIDEAAGRRDMTRSAFVAQAARREIVG